MKSKIILKLPIVSAAWVVAALAVASSVADVPKEGHYDFTSCWSGVSNVIAFSKTHIALSFELTGTNRSNPPGGFNDKTSFRCVGVHSVLDGKGAGTALCEVLDRDGDKILDRFETEGPKQTATFIAGTGKYEGMELSGTAELLGPFPTIKPGTFQNCNHQTGTYRMK
jgi:hypothetical protein